jgi:phage tail-like protein
MDPNGQRFWMLAAEDDWVLLPLAGAPSGAWYDDDDGVLRLASRREGTGALDDVGDDTLDDWRATAIAAIAQVADTRDHHDARAWWDEATRTVRATGPIGGSVAIVGLPAEWGAVTDLTVGYDEVLYVAVDGGVVLHDLRDRWNPVVVRDADMNAWRVAAHPDGGAYVLDQDHLTLWRIIGKPLPERPFAPMAPTVIRPHDENGDPPRAELLMPLDGIGAGRCAGLAVSREGSLAVLAWTNATGIAHAYLPNIDKKEIRAVLLNGARFPYSIAWTSVDDDAALAVLVPALTNEALIYFVDSGNAADPIGDFFPLRAHTGGSFVNSAELPVHYPILPEGDQERPALPLLPISATTLAREGWAQCRAPFDSGSTRTAWHRLYLEGCFPRGCGVRVQLAATDRPFEPPEGEDEEWHEHLFGDVVISNPGHPAARGTWLPEPSELPFHDGFTDHGSSDLYDLQRAGLFTALIQQPNRPVRTLRGRYLWLRLQLTGDGRSTPQIAAIRAYGSRFSYVERYLPEMYHEQELGADANVAFAPAERATTTRADFLERFLGIFESVLTPLEDRIANAYLLTDARTVPSENLEWLASWLGLALDASLPVDRQRAIVGAASVLATEHGTITGLMRALDLATGGAVRGGEIVVVEDFRLRRTMATILGVDMSDEEDEMLAGIADSGNSIVGDTLVLGSEQRAEFLALFRDDFETDAAEDAALQRLFERLAHRLTILVHNDVASQDFGIIRRVAAIMTPAHVEARIVRARYPFMVGIASLVRIDTYLGPPRERTPMVVDRSAIGAQDFLLRESSLDPRLSGANEPSGDRLVPALT